MHEKQPGTTVIYNNMQHCTPQTHRKHDWETGLLKKEAECPPKSIIWSFLGRVLPDLIDLIPVCRALRTVLNHQQGQSLLPAPYNPNTTLPQNPTVIKIEESLSRCYVNVKPVKIKCIPIVSKSFAVLWSKGKALPLISCSSSPGDTSVREERRQFLLLFSTHE